MTPDGYLDEFYLAVKNDNVDIKVDDAHKVADDIGQYLRCPSFPALHKKTFKNAQMALSNMTEPTSIRDFDNTGRSAIQTYVALGHLLGGDSLVWHPTEVRLVPFRNTEIQPIIDNKYAVP